MYYFSYLLKKSSWLLYIVKAVNNETMITFWRAVQDALLAVGAWKEWPYDDSWICDKDDGDDIRSVCYCYNGECFCVFLFLFCLFHERFMSNKCWLCVCIHVCLLLNTYLSQSGKWINVRLSACIKCDWLWECESVCSFVWVCPLLCLDLCRWREKKFNIGTNALRLICWFFSSILFLFYIFFFCPNAISEWFVFSFVLF